MHCIVRFDLSLAKISAFHVQWLPNTFAQEGNEGFLSHVLEHVTSGSVHYVAVLVACPEGKGKGEIAKIAGDRFWSVRVRCGDAHAGIVMTVERTNRLAPICRNKEQGNLGELSLNDTCARDFQALLLCLDV
jgi:hypothetical protein